VWADEVAKWLPGKTAQIVDGKKPAIREQQIAADTDFIIINWEKLWREPALMKQKWGAVIADEAHRAKNRKAKQTKALWQLKAPVQLALTGTPVMNSPDELWPLLKWLRPEQYRSFWEFHYLYVDEYPAYRGTIVTGVKNVEQLRFELSDKIVRRRKSDVLKDLPPKQIVRVPVELTPAQKRLYDVAESELLLDIAEALTRPTEGEPAGAHENRRIAIQQAIENNDIQALTYLIPNGAAKTTRLRQIVSTPALIGGPEDSGKLTAAEEIIRDHPGEPMVVFCWFAETARILAKRLEKGKPALRVGTIAGSDDPDPVKDAFQAGDLDVVVCTIAKGGVGLTLTAASTAIFLERDWVPAINSQAEDRLHRIGQENAVTILILEARGTVDVGKIAPANRLKAMIASQVLGDEIE
jgi:SNF2 family DNA or RNA helicase